MTQFFATLVVTLLAGTIGLYIRDGQNDHKSLAPIGKWFYYTLAGSMFAIVMVILNTCFTPN